MFITTVIAGTIAIIHPFKSMERPFLRDVIFYIAAVFLTFVVFYNRKITLAWSLGMLIDDISFQNCNSTSVPYTGMIVKFELETEINSHPIIYVSK